jgi:large subunit ribosomal protein L10e
MHMALRPAKCYRKLERPYTRRSNRKPKKGYVKGVPDKKIHRFEMGDPKKAYRLKAYIVSERGVQIRHNALEAARIACNKYLVTEIGKENFFMKVLIFPHHVMRENALATGAGADRFSEGMRRAFGKPIGLAARVKPNQRIFEIRLDSGKEHIAKEALRRAVMKFPTPCRIVFETPGSRISEPN